jgi:hypothetical protein
MLPFAVDPRPQPGQGDGFEMLHQPLKFASEFCRVHKDAVIPRIWPALTHNAMITKTQKVPVVSADQNLI